MFRLSFQPSFIHALYLTISSSDPVPEKLSSPEEQTQKKHTSQRAARAASRNRLPESTPNKLLSNLPARQTLRADVSSSSKSTAVDTAGDEKEAMGAVNQGGPRAVAQETLKPPPIPSASYRSLAGEHAAKHARLEMVREQARRELAAEREEQEERLAIASAQVDTRQASEPARENQEREELRAQKEKARLEVSTEKMQWQQE